MKQDSLLKTRLHLFFQNKLSVVGLFIVLFFVIITILSPWIAPYNPYEIQLGEKLLSPTLAHLCGTDELGRDILSRILYGGRTSLMIILLVPLITAPLGLIVGVLAGYFPGFVDNVLMRITDIFLTFPKLILALVFVAVLGPKLENAILAIALASWPPYARICRTEVQIARKSDFITAALLYGVSRPRILAVYMPPLCFQSLVVRMSLEMGGVALMAASLSFLGLGAQPPTPEWGSMAAQGREYIFHAWWMSVFPGFVIFLTSLGLNLMGNGVRDMLDPKNQGRVL